MIATKTARERTKAMQYKGIELEGLDKDVKLAHSRFIETDEGTDWIDKLRSVDKQTLTHIQFHEVSALNSVINMDYQICNGGLSQYFCNGYDRYRKPCHEQDVEQLDKEAQCDMLVELGTFAREVFPERVVERQELLAMQEDLREAEEDDEEEYDGFDEFYFGVSDFVAILCETYAQYLCKAYGIA